MTGQGMKNVYIDIMKEAEKVYLLTGANGLTMRKWIQKIGEHYIDENINVDFFYDPFFEQTVEGIFIKHPKNIFILHGESVHPKIQVDIEIEKISFEDCVQMDERYKKHLINEKETLWNNLFQTLRSALTIHDDWEEITKKRMDWAGLNEQVNKFTQSLFLNQKLNKESKVTHRLLGTLTPNGARDTVCSITKNLNRIVFIKGYPGTGKATVMRHIASTAQNLGYDVQYLWCGLDSRAIDMVILPELNFCIFDSTEPHEYFPQRNGTGELFNMEQFCHLTKEDEEALNKIVSSYKEKMQEATNYAKAYSEKLKQERQMIDKAIDETKLEERILRFFKL